MTQPLDPTLIALAHGCFINQPHQRLLELREQLADAALAWAKASAQQDRVARKALQSPDADEGNFKVWADAIRTAHTLAGRMRDLAAKIEALP